MRSPSCLAITAALAGLVALLPGCGGSSSPDVVLLVTIDTCRADRFGCYGGSVDTPTVDRLAEEGTLFLQADAPAPITLPSHLSILTGLYPDRHGVRDNGAGVLPDEAVTLAEILRDHGWSTAAFVSGVPLDSSFGVDQGFDHYDDDFVSIPESGNILSRLETDQRVATDVTDLAVGWLRKAADGNRPRFAWVHYFDPHSPYTPPPGFAERYGGAPYDGEVAYVDSQLARLVDAVGPGALVVVVADHGESLGEHEEYTHGFFVYESALRVPWILRGPGVPAGRRVDTPVSAVRVMPTILDLLGLVPSGGLDGTSVRPFLRGEDSSESIEPVYAEALFPRLNLGGAPTRSIRTGSWKLIEGPVVELYDLAEDPDELRNVATEHPDVVERLLGDLHDHADRGGELIAEAADLDPEMRQRLEGLGYLGAGGSGSTGSGDLWDFSRRSPHEMLWVFRKLEELPQAVLGGPREEANALVDSLRAMDPGNVPVLKRVMKLRLTAGHLPETIATCREILALEPNDVETLRALASAQMRSEDDAAAMRTIRRALEVDPEDTEGRLLLASLLGEAGRTAEALEEYDRVLARTPDSVRAIHAKALLLSHQGRTDEAVRVLRAGLERQPDDVDLLNNLAWLLANGPIDPAEGLRHARRAREIAPDDPVVLDTFGWAAIRAGHADEAVKPLERALELTGDAEVRAHLGVALSESGRAADGRTLLDAAVKERPALAGIPEVERWRNRPGVGSP